MNNRTPYPRGMTYTHPMKLKPLTAIAVIASVLTVVPGNGEQWFFVPEPGEPNPLGLTVDYPLEDEPGWDCTAQGNRICGPTVTVDGWEPDTGEYIGGYN